MVQLASLKACQPVLSHEILAADLSCDEDESLNFGKGPGGLPKNNTTKMFQHKRPVGIQNLEHWGLVAFPDGKHAGHPFMWVYVNDKGYCKWVMARKRPCSAWMKSFQCFLMAMQNAKCQARFELEAKTAKQKGESKPASSKMTTVTQTVTVIPGIPVSDSE